MSRVLVVSSMALPYLAADAHRARLLAAALPAHGWDVELLVPGDAFQRPEHRERYAERLASPAVVHRAEPEYAGIFHALGARSLGWRAYLPLRRLGNQLLKGSRFDLVYFSCAQPMLFHLGVEWRRRFAVPFVLDLHDPWYSPVIGNAAHLAPGKRRLVNLVARRLEQVTVKAACGLVSVSRGYLETLNERYQGRGWPALAPDRQAVIPFAASDADIEAARLIETPGDPDPNPMTRRIVYTGAGGTIMEQSFRETCALLGEIRRAAPSLVKGLRIELFGTEPVAQGRRPVLSRVAAEEGVSDLVHEFPARLSYLEALHRVVNADGLFIFGVNDPAYVPSKLFLYALTGLPLLACMRADSVTRDYFERVPRLGQFCGFAAHPAGRSGAIAAMRTFLEEVSARRLIDRRAHLSEWLVPAMAGQHARLFDICAGTHGGLAN